MTSLFRRRTGAAALLTFILSCIAAALPAEAVERGPHRATPTVSSVPEVVEAEARVIVKFKAESSLMRAQSVGSSAAAPQHARSLSARLGLSLTDGRAIGARAQVLKAKGMSSRDLADRISKQSDVEFAVVDGRMRALAVPNDPLYAGSATTSPASGQWYLRPPTSATIADATSVVSSINAQAAWDITTGSNTIVVADLDTGIRKDHPDFVGKLLAGYDFIKNAGTSGDGQSTSATDNRDPDPSDSGDFVSQADVNAHVSGCTQSDVGTHSSWHGTQTAGLIGAATNNGVGMASVGGNVMLLPVRVLGKCGGWDSDIQAAILWAAGVSSVPIANPNPAKVINLSLGSSANCSAGYQDVVRQVNQAGTVVVAAAGNDGVEVGSPANCPGVIAVAGVRHAGTKVGYSDLGPEVAIAAPAGNCVNTSGACLFPLLTTSNNGATTPNPGATGAIYTDGGDDPSLGTSFSSPLVAGTVGLMFSIFPSLTPTQVLGFLQSSARTFPTSGAPQLDDGTGTLHTVTACVVPTATTPRQNTECYCTTSTCGAGLLDAGAALAAVAVVAPAIATIAVASTAVVEGDTVALDGSTSRASPGNGSLTYAWTVVSGPGSITSSSTASTATLVTSAVGSVVVNLTVTDSAGRQGTSNVTLSASAPVVAPATTASSDGGGGAMQPGWLIGWLAAVIAMWVATPRRRRPV